jgi:hypothetical protein|tara:strand:+ start:1966 stop:2415 length:450 start_codon:yes stop_codon:yes gene_type:complete
MTKRGSMLVPISIISLIIIVIVGFGLPNIAKVYASGKVALKTAAARDIALILGTIYAYPYDVEIEYDIDLSDFTVEICKKTVKISEEGLDLTARQYPFVPVDDDPKFVLDGAEKIFFKKEEGKITCQYQNEDRIIDCEITNCEEQNENI